MKKDFALDLNGCSKEDRKKVIEAAKTFGCRWWDAERFKTKDFERLHIDLDDKDMYYVNSSAFDYREILTMPQDWDKIQEALGVEVEPKDGEVYSFDVYGDKWIVRFSRSEFVDEIKYFSYSNITNKYFSCDEHDYFNGTEFKTTKATPEEESELIEAEHANGWHWDGKELVKIPEYVECIEWNLKDFFKVGCIYKTINNIRVRCDNGKVSGNTVFGLIRDSKFKPSTREAYETQESKKEYTEDVITNISEAFKKETISLRGRLLKKSDLIAALERDRMELAAKCTNLRLENIELKKQVEKLKSNTKSTSIKIVHEGFDVTQRDNVITYTAK